MVIKGMIRLIAHLLLGANIVSVALMLLTGYSYHVDPINFSLIATLGMFFPVFMVINALFLIFWLFIQRKAALLSFIAFILCYFPVKTYIGINMPSKAPPGAIKVMSYNVLNYHGMQDEPSDDLKNKIVDFLINSDCDIICLQEANEKSLPEDLRKRLNEAYPNSHIDSKAGQYNDMALYSKYKILSSDTIAFESVANISVAYVLQTEDEKILVINNHLESNHLSEDDKNHLRNMITGDVKGDYVGEESKSLFAKLTESSLVRNHQAKAVAKFVEQNKGMPIILCGDFNETPISFNHHVISQNLTDCYVASGIGPGWSYCHSGMRVRIDNIMCSSDYQPYGCKVLSDVPYSDHFPIVCWLKTKGSKNDASTDLKKNNN